MRRQARIPGCGFWLGGLLIAAALVGIYGYVLIGRNTPPGKFDPSNPAAYMARLGRSDTAEARRVKADLAHAAEDLRREREAAQREGIPVFPSQLQTPPIPAAINAAPLYGRLHAAIRQSSSSAGQLYLNQPIGPSMAWTPQDLAVARQELRQSQAALDLIHRAANLPRCDFQRNWALGPGLLFPEYADMRSAGRMLCSESYLLTLDGKWSEAVANQARGFRVAQHAGEDPCLIGYLVGNAIDAISVGGMTSILRMAGPNPEVAAMIKHAVSANRPHLSLRHAFGGESGTLSVTMNMIRQARKTSDLGGLFEPAQTFMSGPAGPLGGSQNAGRDFTPEERRFFAKVVDAAEARILHAQRLQIAAADGPPDRYEAACREAEAQASQDSSDPSDAICKIMLPVFSQAGVAAVRSEAKAQVLTAACDIMAFCGRTGSFPDSLDKAGKPPLDPFTGKPLNFRREPGGFVVYSVGEDGKFDGGKPGMRRDSQQAYFRWPPDKPMPPDRQMFPLNQPGVKRH